MIFAEQQEQMWVNAMEDTDNSNFEVIEVAIDPYGYVVDSGFDEVNEDVVFENISYHVFKKRIQNNVLKFYCLRNLDQKAFTSEFKKIVNSQLFDNDSSKEHPTKKLIKSFINDYIPNNPGFSIATTIVVYPETILSYHPKSVLLSGYFTLNYPPPNMV